MILPLDKAAPYLCVWATFGPEGDWLLSGKETREAVILQTITSRYFLVKRLRSPKGATDGGGQMRQ